MQIFTISFVQTYDLLYRLVLNYKRIRHVFFKLRTQSPILITQNDIKFLSTLIYHRSILHTRTEIRNHLHIYRIMYFIMVGYRVRVSVGCNIQHRPINVREKGRGDLFFDSNRSKFSDVKAIVENPRPVSHKQTEFPKYFHEKWQLMTSKSTWSQENRSQEVALSLSVALCMLLPSSHVTTKIYKLS